MSNMEILYNELTARYEELKQTNSLENIFKRAELVKVITRVQDLLILELREQIEKLEK